MLSTSQWYLVRTKPGKEKWVRDQLSVNLPEVFLPLLRARMPKWGRLAVSVAPLFPCYLFAKFDLSEHYFEVKYLPGVQGLVSAGRDPITVSEPIIGEIRRRGVDGIVEIPDEPFGNGERVRVMDGPFRGFDAIFERYLSSSERVAILLGAVQTGGLRVVLPAAALAKYN